MVNMGLRQYRYFIYSPRECNAVYNAVTARMPDAKQIFRNVALQNDPIMFCHEAAHSMEFVRKGKFDRLMLPDYGWPILQRDGWTKKMADNESRVFAQQELLAELLGFKNSDILDPQGAGIFLAFVSGDRYRGQFYKDLILKYKEELRGDFEEVFNEFIKFLVANVDRATVAA